MYLGYQRRINRHGGKNGVGFPVIDQRTAEELGLERYFTGLPCNSGHNVERYTISRRCVECVKFRSKRHYIENHERESAAKLDYYHGLSRNGKKKWNARSAQWARDNPDKRAKIMRNWKNENAAKWNSYQRQYQRHKLRTDENFKLALYLRTRPWQAIKGIRKAGSFVRDLGCSIEEVRIYIEQKFSGRMSWKNWGSYWELDHVKPLAMFDLTNRRQFLRACHYTNLQPLSIKEHRRKTNAELVQAKAKSYSKRVSTLVRRAG
jgi:hypothetical protein